MEFGALFCTPQNPDCERCVLQPSCLALSQKKVKDYPVKLTRTVVKELYYYYFVITFVKQGEPHILLNHRNSKGIWRKLYDFPLLESPTELDYDEVLSAEPAKIILNEIPVEISAISDEYIHILSHRKLITRFFRIKIQQQPESILPYIAVPVSQIGRYPIPRLIDRYMRAEKLLVPGYAL
jgi:A/G-specific adenine glycosylase